MTDMIVKTLPTACGKQLGVLAFNRPKSLNALNLNTLHATNTALDAWEHDPTVVGIVVVGVGEKSFCAGGDIADIRGRINGGDTAGAYAHFLTEYQCFERVKIFPKPIIAIAHGITMGGGFGALESAHHRIVTNAITLAMPEVNIGLYPDVHACKFLSAMPLWLMRFVGMTGAFLNAGDALNWDLADCVLDSKTTPPDTPITNGITGVPAVDNAVQTLTQGQYTGDKSTDDTTIATLLKTLHTTAIPQGHLKPRADTIAQLTDTPTLGHSLMAMQKLGATLDPKNPTDPWLAQCLMATYKGCPNSVALWWAWAEHAQTLTDQHARMAEVTLSAHMVCDQPDFAEGVRAVLIDKDRNPKWQNTHMNVDTHAINAVCNQAISDGEKLLV